MEWFFDYVWGWYGVIGVVVVVCVVVAILLPQFRLYAGAVGLGALGLGSVYAKGQRDRAKLEERRKEEAVRQRKADDDKIDRRPDKPSDVEKRLRRGDF